jgi:hypothetical protein
MTPTNVPATATTVPATETPTAITDTEQTATSVAATATAEAGSGGASVPMNFTYSYIAVQQYYVQMSNTVLATQSNYPLIDAI